MEANERYISCDCPQGSEWCIKMCGLTDADIEAFIDFLVDIGCSSISATTEAYYDALIHGRLRFYDKNYTITLIRDKEDYNEFIKNHEILFG